MGLFGGLGYALACTGYNVGVKLRSIDDDPVSRLYGYVVAMFGYNACIVIENSNGFDKLFYGFSFGVGVDVRPRESKGGYWSLMLLLPIRDHEVGYYINELKNNYNLQLKSPSSPVYMSASYRRVLKKRMDTT